jgi:uncharacterized membrane protein
MVPEEKVIKLEMSVADGIKYVISLGAIAPGYAPASYLEAKGLPGGLPSPAAAPRGGGPASSTAGHD